MEALYNKELLRLKEQWERMEAELEWRCCNDLIEYIVDHIETDVFVQKESPDIVAMQKMVNLNRKSLNNMSHNNTNNNNNSINNKNNNNDNNNNSSSGPTKSRSGSVFGFFKSKSKATTNSSTDPPNKNKKNNNKDNNKTNNNENNNNNNNNNTATEEDDRLRLDDPSWFGESYPNLSDEMILYILDHLIGRPSVPNVLGLMNLSLTCKKLYRICQESKYQIIV